MPSLTMPDLDKLYREAGLRNSKTRDSEGYAVNYGRSFYSFGDFKREVRALLIVPIICTVEVLKKALQAVSDLLIAAVQLATLDGRGFHSLSHFFVNAAQAINLAITGVFHTVGSLFSLYTRSVSTFFTSVGNLFENEETEQEFVFDETITLVRPQAADNDLLQVEVSAFDETTTFLRPQAANYDRFEVRVSAVPSAPRASSMGMFAKTRRELALENLDSLGLKKRERDVMAADIVASPDYDEPTNQFSRR